MKTANIRNFCIIAHIDHGKSTLADRLIEVTHTVEQRKMRAQLLDQMDIEREKGITIKLQPIRMLYDENGQDYQLNLIDTPGHVDFTYEVSRSLAACEGALLLVDATQGVQAQTIANIYLAMEANLTLVPVINKIDLPAANVEKTKHELVSLLACQSDEIILASAKTGEGTEQILKAIIKRIPPPSDHPDQPLRALVFDSTYDDYRGVMMYLRVFDGQLKSGQAITMMATGVSGTAKEVGHLAPFNQADDVLANGEIGYCVTDLKDVTQSRVGDTVTSSDQPADQPLTGYKTVKPFVYAGVFPIEADDYHRLKEALQKLALNDASLQYEPENSQLLGFGFRVGFLGLLHLEIVKERLERDYNLELIVTNPSTGYRIEMTGGQDLDIKSATDLPDPSVIVTILEPWIKGEIVTPKDYVGSVLQLIARSRGLHKSIDYLDDQLATIDFEAPMSNLLTDFYDSLKSLTSGYGSYAYELDDYRPGDLVKLDFLVAGDRVDSLSVIVHRTEAEPLGRLTVKKLKKVIPKQLFKVALQAAIGGKIIAREDISALKKDVTANIYGGDVSRKKKLWAKQKKGKARMKKFGSVEIPSEAFTVMLKRED